MVSLFLEFSISHVRIKTGIKEDAEEIVLLYKNAIAKMDEQNIPQWDEIYPDRATLEDDALAMAFCSLPVSKWETILAPSARSTPL